MTDHTIKPLLDFLQGFSNIPDADKERISQNTSFRSVKEGTVLLQDGKRAKEMFFVCNGILKIVSTNEKGSPVTLFFIRENHFCTVLNSFLNNVVSTESIVAACDTELIIFAKQDLHRLYETIPYFEALIKNITHQALLNKLQVRNAFMGEDATTRYQKFMKDHPEIALRVSLSDIASYLGITQQSLSRIRRNTLES